MRLLGSGAILREVIAASELLASDWQVASEVFSVTSFSELAREARDVDRAGRLGQGSADLSHVQRCLDGDAPVIAATDYVRAWPQLIAEYVQAPYVTLGTDVSAAVIPASSCAGSSRSIVSALFWQACTAWCARVELSGGCWMRRGRSMATGRGRRLGIAEAHHGASPLLQAATAAIIKNPASWRGLHF